MCLCIIQIKHSYGGGLNKTRSKALTPFECILKCNALHFWRRHHIPRAWVLESGGGGGMARLWSQKKRSSGTVSPNAELAPIMPTPDSKITKRMDRDTVDNSVLMITPKDRRVVGGVCRWWVEDGWIITGALVVMFVCTPPPSMSAVCKKKIWGTKLRHFGAMKLLTVEVGQYKKKWANTFSSNAARFFIWFEPCNKIKFAI